MRLEIRPVTRSVQRIAVAAWHSHHARSTPGERLALGAFVDSAIVAVIVFVPTTSADVRPLRVGCSSAAHEHLQIRVVA